ncbi:MAG: hypothetical protein IPM84_15575 [Anaerolineae bacterium]|nr:hypothetical protein [Anaerolineae bacterium]
MRQERWAEADVLLQEALTLQRQRQDTHAQVETIYKLAMIAKAQGRSEEQLVEILRPAWELAQEHGYGRWLVNMAWLLGDAVFEQGASGAYNYYATAAVIARQYEDEERYLESIKMLAERIAELVSHGQDHNAHFLCQYLIDYRRENGWEEWVEDAIDTLIQLAATIQAGESVSVPSSVMGANAVD